MMPIKQVQAGRMSSPLMPNVAHAGKSGGHVFQTVRRSGKARDRLRIFCQICLVEVQVEQAQAR